MIFASEGWVNANIPTPAAPAVTAYDLRIFSIDSGSFAIARRFMEPSASRPLRSYFPGKGRVKVSYAISPRRQMSNAWTWWRAARPFALFAKRAEACRLRGHGQCLERREEITGLSAGTAALVAAVHPASDRTNGLQRPLIESV